MEAIRYALDDLVIPEIAEGEAEVADEQVVEPIETPQTRLIEEEEGEVPPAFPDLPSAKITEPDVDFVQEMDKARKRKPVLEEVPTSVETDEEVEAGYEDESKDKSSKKKGKKNKQRRVELIYDEDSGEVVAKRRRKGSRRREDDFDDLNEVDF
jgi:hypothetical protein